MASNVPGPLKSADIARFAMRAAQLEKVKPVISYWCTLYMVETILRKGLEEANDECKLFTAALMDKLEQSKLDNEGNDAIRDDLAAQAYVEQFALETFDRADKALQSRAATVRTADTFQAAATFLDVLAVWPKSLSPEITAKSKYAKYHALRILKAIKAGDDPNLPEDAPEPHMVSPPPLDPEDPEVQGITSLQPTGEDAAHHAALPSFHQPLAHQPTVSTQSPAITPFSPMQQDTAGGDVSPLEPEPPADGYFPPSAPSLPTFTADSTSPNLPTASPGPQIAPSMPVVSSPLDPQQFYHRQSHISPPSMPSQPPIMPSNIAFQPSAPASEPSAPPPQPMAPQSVTLDGPEIFNRDDEAILAAAKHGKWAVSALNFDDVDTAVKEFRLALQYLGAR